MRNKINTYAIQDWLFSEAEGRFDIDLAESGIQYHHLFDLDTLKNYDLNYSLDAGKQTLRQVIADMYGVSRDRVVVTHGSQEALYLFYRSYLCPGDHVITFTPGWQQSWEVPASCGADVEKIALRREDGYQLDLDFLKTKIRSNTKLVILNSPNNPVGVVYSEALLREFFALCARHNIFVVNDEEYVTDYTQSVIHTYPQRAVVSSLSKVYGFPGLRLGWLIADPEVVRAVINYKRYTTVSNSSLCEYLAEQVLQNRNYYLAEYQQLIANRYGIIANWVKRHSEWLSWVSPQKTPYAYVTFNEMTDSAEFARQLLKAEKVLVMPAEVFADHSALRISYGRPETVLVSGLGRMGHFLVNAIGQTHATIS